MASKRPSETFLSTAESWISGWMWAISQATEPRSQKWSEHGETLTFLCPAPKVTLQATCHPSLPVNHIDIFI